MVREDMQREIGRENHKPDSGNGTCGSQLPAIVTSSDVPTSPQRGIYFLSRKPLHIERWNCFKSSNAVPESLRGRHPGVQRRGEQNLPKWFLTPFVWYVFHPPRQRSVPAVYKSKTFKNAAQPLRQHLASTIPWTYLCPTINLQRSMTSARICASNMRFCRKLVQSLVGEPRQWVLLRGGCVTFWRFSQLYCTFCIKPGHSLFKGSVFGA